MARVIKKQGPGSLNITSMMDMFTIVLVFLLKSMAAEGNLMTSNSNLVLPLSSRSQSPTEVSLTISGDTKTIVADDQIVATTEEIKKQDSLIVQSLYDVLKKKREEEKKAEILGVIKESTGKVVVQFDKNTEYSVVTKVMATCGYAGYSNIKFAVLKKGEEG